MSLMCIKQCDFCDKRQNLSTVRIKNLTSATYTYTGMKFLSDGVSAENICEVPLNLTAEHFLAEPDKSFCLFKFNNLVQLKLLTMHKLRIILKHYSEF